MPTSVALGSYFEDFVKQQVSSGRYNNASEVVRDGLRMLQDHEDLRRTKLQWLQNELQRGVDSGPATAFDIQQVKAAGQHLRAQRQGTKAKAL